MSEWSYLVKEIETAATVETLQKRLDDSGCQGWEMVSIMTLPNGKLVAIFKKPSVTSRQN